MGIGGHAILPFLETPGTKVQIVMIIQVGNSCVQFGDLLVATLRLSSGNKCHFHYQARSQDFLNGVTSMSNVYVCYINKQAGKTRGGWGDAPPENF